MSSVLLGEASAPVGLNVLLGEDGTDLLLEIQDDFDRAGTYRRSTTDTLSGVAAVTQLATPRVRLSAQVPVRGVPLPTMTLDVVATFSDARAALAALPAAQSQLRAARASAAMRMAASGVGAVASLGVVTSGAAAQPTSRHIRRQTALGRVAVTIGPDLVDEEFHDLVVLLDVI